MSRSELATHNLYNCSKRVWLVAKIKDGGSDSSIGYDACFDAVRPPSSSVAEQLPSQPT